jgi:hypothetical protein
MFAAISLAGAVGLAATSESSSDPRLQAKIRAEDQAMMDAFGSIVGYVDRRKGEDVVWRNVAAQ